MPQNYSFYRDVDREIDHFFENSVKPLLSRIRRDSTSEIKETLIELKSEIQRLRTGDEERYFNKLEILNGRLDEISSLGGDQKSPEFAKRWIDGIRVEAAKLPVSIEVRQDEMRFIKGPDDTFSVSFLKFWKSLLFRVFKIPLHFKNWVMKILGRDYEPEYFWLQVIPLSRLVLHRLAGDIKWVPLFISAELQEISKIIEFLLEKEEPTEAAEKETDNEESEAQNKSTFRLPVFVELEKHVERSLEHIKKYESFQGFYHSDYSKVIAGIKKDAAKAGTVELRKKLFDENNIEDNIQYCLDATEKNESLWLSFMRSQISDLQIQLELARFGVSSSKTQNNLLEKSHLFFRDLFYVPLENIVQEIQNAVKTLKSNDNKKSKSDRIQEVKTRISNKILNESENKLGNSALKEQLLGEMHQAISNLQMEMNNFSEEVSVAEKKESKLPQPLLEIDTFQWRSVASRFLKSEAIRHLDPESQSFSEFIENRIRELEEVDGIVKANLMASMESKDSGDSIESTIEIAISGLERAVSAIEKSIKSVRVRQDEYESIIQTKLPLALQKIADVMLSRKFDAFEMEDKARQVKSRALNWKEKLDRYLAILLEKAELAKRFITRKFRQIKDPVLNFLGYKQDAGATAKQKHGVTEYLSGITTILKKLPYIYQRLFSRDILIEKRFYIAPSGSLQVMEKNMEQWHKGIEASIAVVGEKGSGKTTLIHFFEDSITSDIPIVKIEFSETFCDKNQMLKRLSDALGFSGVTSVQGLVEQINGGKERKVVIVESLQNAYIRYINGFEALEQFFVLMSQTSGKLFWTVTCSRFAWQFFTKVLNADQYFSQVVNPDILRTDQITEAILSRHKATGYDLEFEVPENLKKTRTFRKVAGNDSEIQDLVRKHFFDELSKVAEGNFSIAMIFWIKSIKEHDDKTFVISPIEVADIDILEVPSKEVLFLLATLVKHDLLNAEQVAQSLHQPLESTRLLLARLKSKGLVLYADEGYVINHLVFRQIIRLLKSRNILH